MIIYNNTFISVIKNIGGEYKVEMCFSIKVYKLHSKQPYKLTIILTQSKSPTGLLQSL